MNLEITVYLKLINSGHPSVILKKVWNSNSYWIMISYHVIDILQFLLMLFEHILQAHN